MNLVFSAINLLLQILEWALLARVIISWIPVPRTSQIVRILYQITEPILAPIRSMVQRSNMGRNMMFDFSPLIAFFLIWVVRNIIVRIAISSGSLFI